MKLSRTQLTALIIAVMAMMTSCRDELCYNHFASLALTLDWEHEWERDYGMAHSKSWDEELHGYSYDALRPGKPEWVNLVRFMPDGNRTEDYLQEEKGDIRIDQVEGQSLLLYNGDTEYIVIEDIASLNDARATPTTRTRSTITYMTEQHPGVSTTNPPDVLYSTFIENIPLVGTHEAVQYAVRLQPLVFTYVVRYEFEYGLEHVRQARGALGGMAKSVYLKDGRTSDEATIILYDCEVNSYGCEAQVRSFGIPGFPDEYYGRAAGERSERPYTLNLEVLLKNGKTVEFNFDIADQLAKQPKGGVIRVKGLRIEDNQSDPNESEGGFDVDLSGWGNVEVDLPPIDINKDQR